MHDFLRKGKDKSEGSNLVNWNITSCLSLKVAWEWEIAGNADLLAKEGIAKRGWRYMNEHNSLWRKVIDSKYAHRNDHRIPQL